MWDIIITAKSDREPVTEPEPQTPPEETAEDEAFGIEIYSA